MWSKNGCITTSWASSYTAFVSSVGTSILCNLGITVQSRSEPVMEISLGPSLHTTYICGCIRLGLLMLATGPRPY
ncbi:hypothetical protein F5Y04DRAFT_241489, partial [Hypomontagnella monticulosa]